jgi:hypothetical protein
LPTPTTGASDLCVLKNPDGPLSARRCAASTTQEMFGSDAPRAIPVIAMLAPEALAPFGDVGALRTLADHGDDSDRESR